MNPAERRRARIGFRRMAGHCLIALSVFALVVGSALLLGTVLRTAAPVAPGYDPIPIHVATNGFHTDILVPMVHEEMDWRPLLDLSPITRPFRDAPYLALGWGSRTAYTQLGTLSDLSFGLLLKAAAFDASVVHLQPVTAIREGAGLRRLVVTADGYRGLVRHVEASLRKGSDGRFVALGGLSHGTGDAFLEGRDRFWLLRSCNVWVAEALRQAGIRVGLWTPLAQSLMWSLDSTSDADRPR